MKKSSLRTVKEKNRRLILRALLTEGGLSRIELAKQTGLQPVAKDTITNETAHKTIVEFNDYTFEESDGITTWLDTAPESRVKEKFLENLQLIIDGKDASEIMKEIQDVAAQVREEYAN